MLIAYRELQIQIGNIQKFITLSACLLIVALEEGQMSQGDSYANVHIMIQLYHKCWITRLADGLLL